MDFGPCYGYWLFSFERFNGIIKDIDTNQKDHFEVTCMKQFLRSSFGSDLMTDTIRRELQDNQLATKIASLLVSSPRRQNSSQWVDTCFDYFAFLQVTDLDAPNVDARPLATSPEPLPPSSYPVKTGKLVYMDPTHFQQLVSYYDAVDEEHYTYFGASDEHQGIVVNDRIRKIRDVGF